MRQQTKIPPPILTCHELADLRATLKDALHCLVQREFPIHSGTLISTLRTLLWGRNVASSGLAEAHVGHPFLTFEYLIAHHNRSGPARPKFEDKIRSTYASVWACATSPEKSMRHLRLRHGRCLAHAVTTNIWRDPVGLEIPGVLAFP